MTLVNKIKIMISIFILFLYLKKSFSIMLLRCKSDTHILPNYHISNTLIKLVHNTLDTHKTKISLAIEVLNKQVTKIDKRLQIEYINTILASYSTNIAPYIVSNNLLFKELRKLMNIMQDIIRSYTALLTCLQGMRQYFKIFHEKNKELREFTYTELNRMYDRCILDIKTHDFSIGSIIPRFKESDICDIDGRYIDKLENKIVNMRLQIDKVNELAEVETITRNMRSTLDFINRHISEDKYDFKDVAITEDNIPIISNNICCICHSPLGCELLCNKKNHGNLVYQCNNVNHIIHKECGEAWYNKSRKDRCVLCNEWWI